MAARVLSVNLAEMRTIRWRGQDVRTGIFKQPVEGPVMARGVNLAGDDQADRRVHGGADKAVYAYAREDTEWWEAELGRELEHGTFGENPTLRGVDASGAVIGERWRIGAALFEVSEPRLPCFKLGVKMDDNRFLKRFSVALRPGCYLRIIEEGELSAGDAVEAVERPDHGVTVRDLARTFLFEKDKAPALLAAPALSPPWREFAEGRAA